ncbi:hypothetical protein, partial [Acinetobacter baumannii]|uniref:hypothetical protein n=1 Tax=Acinetobacter baumannii TaxID=470 RepID=UPI0013D3A1D9
LDQNGQFERVENARGILGAHRFIHADEAAEALLLGLVAALLQPGNTAFELLQLVGALLQPAQVSAAERA